MRRVTAPFIPAQPERFFNEQNSQRVAAILGTVGQGVGMVAGLVQQDAERDAARSEAFLKIDQAQREAEGDLAHAQQEAALKADIQSSRLQEQKDRNAAAMAQQRIKEIEELERHDVWASVNRLTPDQLRSASAFNLGFRSKDAMRAVNRAIGARQALNDLPQLQTRIATDFSKTGSQHLNEWLGENKLEADEPNLAYVETLTSRLNDDLAARQRRDVANNARNNEILALDELNFYAATNFDIATRDDLIGRIRGTVEQIRATNPTITDAEALSDVVAAIEPVLVGPEARYSAPEVLGKLGQLFQSREELEAFGFGGIAARLEGQLSNAAKNEADGVARLARRQLEAAPSHEHVRAISAAINADPRLSGLQKQELAQLSEDRLAAPDYLTDVQRRASGDTDIAITEAHDEAVLAYLGDRAADPNFTIEQQLNVAAADLGRVPQLFIDDINALVVGGEDREAVARFAVIAASNPRLARSLEDKVSPKVYALSMLSTLGIPDVDRYIESFANVSDEEFAQAEGIFEKALEDAQKKGDRFLGAKANISMVGLAFNAIGRDSDSSAVMDASVPRAYQQLLHAGIATQIANGGENETSVMVERAHAFATTVLRRHIGEVKLGGDRYIMTNAEISGYGFANAEGEYKDGVSTLWRRTREDIEDAVGADVRLDFSEAEVIDRDGRQYVSVPIDLEDELFGVGYVGTFEFPRNSPTELKRLLDDSKPQTTPLFTPVITGPSNPFLLRGRP